MTCPRVAGTADFYISHGVIIKPVDWLADSEEAVSIKVSCLALGPAPGI